MNTSKTKHRNEDNEIVINNEIYKESNEFKYLGSLVTYDNDCSKDIKARMAAGNRCFFALAKAMKTRYLSKQTKLQIYNTVIKPTVMYGCEAWIMTKEIQLQLKRWEKKNLGKIYGSIKD